MIEWAGDRPGITMGEANRQSRAGPIEHSHFRTPEIAGYNPPASIQSLHGQQREFRHPGSHIEAPASHWETPRQHSRQSKPQSLARATLGFPESIPALMAIDLPQHTVGKP